MANFWPGDPSHPGIYEGETSTCSQNKPEEGGCWYYSRREIEEHSPSKLDGIDMKKETYLRKSYCTFLQDLGMRLKVPQLTIATAIIFCHRFFLRQSHARNDRRTIATACMFLAGKVEETPHPLKDVILVSYEIIHKKDKDPNAVHRIKQKEVYEQQKELILLGERVVLSTLDFDLNLLHPYKPLVEAIRKFKVAQNALAQVAWNFVNDGLRTSLCLQFKPHHIAAGAIFLAAKFLKVKLPSDGERVWWQEFDVTPRQLEEVSNQMLELYEQNRVPPSQGRGDAEGSAATGVVTHQASSKAPSSSQEYAPTTTYCSQASVTTSRPGNSWLTSSKPGVSEQSFADSHCGPPRSTQNLRNDQRHMDFENHIDDDDAYGESKGVQERSIDRKEKSKVGELEDAQIVKNEENKGGKVGQSTKEAIKKIDREKVKAALEKRRKTRVDITRKTDMMDEDDLIERELEAGIELASETQKKQDNNRQSSRVSDLENVEEGEVSTPVDLSRSSNRKRKAESPLEKTSEDKQRSAPHYNHYEYAEDRNQNRHLPENHV